MDEIGRIKTANPLVNRLFRNALWGQRGNFVHVPTDCPQRDERMGWTGDAQVFSGTACYNMDAAAFFGKYLYDLWKEQSDLNGVVPMVIPAGKMKHGGSSAWGDVATVAPWDVYLHYGDPEILKQQFESIEAWVDDIKKRDDESGGKRLWTVTIPRAPWVGPQPTTWPPPTTGTPPDWSRRPRGCWRFSWIWHQRKTWNAFVTTCATDCGRTAII